jgi:hypothetical protein
VRGSYGVRENLDAAIRRLCPSSPRRPRGPLLSVRRGILVEPMERPICKNMDRDPNEGAKWKILPGKVQITP